MSVLDESGLAYFWSKIKEYISSRTVAAYPKAGTYNNQTWYGGGFVSRGGRAIFFEIPFPGAINRTVTITCTGLLVRKVGGYVVNGITESTSGYTFEYTKTPIGIRVVVEKTSIMEADENLPVGIQFQYNMTVS